MSVGKPGWLGEGELEIEEEEKKERGSRIGRRVRGWVEANARDFYVLLLGSYS